ncbi:hypothetical protein B0T25DRAFT_536176 [Lasiosphaeria hispida]|uniref:Ubiquitin-like protease family profile domain-containing protein n=1 Tax=Lasiosphaeria hispida TaxID=260671 RepID=A0AAJ0HSY9_9PEZI|nr:hypothetical protein B0T25DRAFT_536176 [Lasiosphaeria hispida]
MEKDAQGRIQDRQALADVEQAELTHLKELIDAFEKQRPQALLDNHRSLIATHGIDTTTRIIFLLPTSQRDSYLGVLARDIYGGVLDARSVPPLIKVCHQWQLLPTSLHEHFGCSSRTFFHSLQHAAAQYSFAETHAAVNAAAATRKNRLADDLSAFSGVPRSKTHIPDDIKQALLRLDAARSGSPAIPPGRSRSKRNRDGDAPAARSIVPKRVRRGRARASLSHGGGVTVRTRSQAAAHILGHSSGETQDQSSLSSEADTEADQSSNGGASPDSVHAGLDDGRDDGLDDGFTSVEDDSDSIGSALEEPASPPIAVSVPQSPQSPQSPGIEVARRMEQHNSRFLNDITMPSPLAAKEAQSSSRDLEPSPSPCSPNIMSPNFDLIPSSIDRQDVVDATEGAQRPTTKDTTPNVKEGASAIDPEKSPIKPTSCTEILPDPDPGIRGDDSTILPADVYAQGTDALQKHLGYPAGNPGSMARFAPGKWLDDINIDAVLGFLTLSSESVIHISPTTVDAAQVDRQISRITGAGTQLEMALLPLLVRGSHWILAVARPKSECIDIYDSLQDGNGMETVRRRIKALLDRLQLHSWNYFAIRDCLSLRQSNLDDCGVLCLATAAHLVTGQAFPQDIDAQLWRGAFKIILARNLIDGINWLSSLPELPQHRMPQNTQLDGHITPAQLTQLEQTLRSLKAEVKRDYIK